MKTGCLQKAYKDEVKQNKKPRLVETYLGSWLFVSDTTKAYAALVDEILFLI